jgi:hypothetical protein
MELGEDLSQRTWDLHASFRDRIRRPGPNTQLHRLSLYLSLTSINQALRMVLHELR